MAWWKNSYLEEGREKAFFERKQLRKCRIDETKGEVSCEPTQRGSLSVVAVQTEEGLHSPSPWPVKTLWHLQLKEFHFEVKKLRKCYSYKLLNCGALGDISLAQDAIKHTFQRGRLNGTKCSSGCWREQRGQWWVTSEEISSLRRRLLKSVSHQPLLFRCTTEMFSDRKIVFNCIKILGNLVTIIIACCHSVTGSGYVAISYG